MSLCIKQSRLLDSLAEEGRMAGEIRTPFWLTHWLSSFLFFLFCAVSMVLEEEKDSSGQAASSFCNGKILSLFTYMRISVPLIKNPAGKLSLFQ